MVETTLPTSKTRQTSDEEEENRKPRQDPGGERDWIIK